MNQVLAVLIILYLFACATAPEKPVVEKDPKCENHHEKHDKCEKGHKK